MPTLKANRPDAAIVEIVVAAGEVVVAPAALADHVREARVRVVPVGHAPAVSAPVGQADPALVAAIATVADLAMISAVDHRIATARRVRRKSRFAMLCEWKFCRSQRSH
jgi:hypothetical protein